MESGETHYTTAQLFWYLGGFLLWGIAYVVVLINIRKHRFVEIPAMAVCGNVTWEFLWGFVWHVEMMGQTLQWFYRLGCLLDIGILFLLFRYGAQQFTLPVLKRWFHAIVVSALVGWATFYWFFVNQGYDLPLGSNSAYIVNLIMSVVYTLLVLRMADVAPFSMAVAWLKGLGTGMVTVFTFLAYPDNDFVHAMGLMCAVLDGFYVYVLSQRKRGRWAPPGS